MKMGYWYWRSLENATVLNENTTNKIDLPERGALSALLVHLQVVNAAGNYALDNGWPFQQVTLKVNGNGNVPIINLRGRQLEALNFWESGIMPKNNLWDDINGTVDAYAYIPFGRYLADMKYGLFLEKFTAGVELEESNTISTTYFTDGYYKIDLVALMRKNPEAELFSGGYLKKRQVKNKDTASETQYGVKLPTTNRLRNIHLFTEPDISSNVPATGPFTNLQYLWLGLRSKEEYVLNNVSTSLFARYIYELMKRRAVTQGITKVASASDNFFDTQIYEREDTQITPMDTSAVMAAEDGTTFWERISKLYAWNAAGTRVSKYCYVKASGICYHGLVPLLMIDPLSDEAEWLDADLEKDVYVEFTEGASTGNVYVVLDELEKSYPGE